MRDTKIPPPPTFDTAFGIVVRALLIGVIAFVAGTAPRNLLFAANLFFAKSIPWAIPATALYLWFYWRYMKSKGLRVKPVSAPAWTWSIIAGGLGIVALVLALRVANRMVALPAQALPNLGDTPQHTVIALLLFAAPVAGIIEEASFRGFMQGPIEKRCGLPLAIVLTGTMFAVFHMDFSPVLWPYYVAVAAIYGVVTSLTDSILPAIVLHSAGNLYSNFDLWLRGRAEWQATNGPIAKIWETGADANFWTSVAGFALFAAASTWAYFRLAATCRQTTPS